MRIWAFLVLSLAASSAFALPTLEDVEHAVHRGDYSSAESMTREVVAARPNSAKAHYILAEILAHEGKVAEARMQAASARQLDPQIQFTAPDKFRQFEAQLGVRSPNATTAAPARDSTARKTADSDGGVSMTWVIVLLVGAGLVFFMLRRRPSTPPGYGNSYPAPNGMPGAPGTYGGPGYPGYGPVPPAGSGMGGRVAAGLGGVAAGMVAEHLIEEAFGNRHANAAELPFDHGAQNPQSLEDRPIDFGNGNDWGGDAGGGDASAGFDSGGSDDWS